MAVDGIAVLVLVLVPALPVLLMSGYAETASGGSVRDGLPNVCAPVIEKPFAGDVLVAAVRRAAETRPALD